MERRKQILKIGTVFLAIAAVVWTTQAFAQAENPVATVLKINGKLQYRPTTDQEWKDAQVKQMLYNGNQLRTETGDKALIIYIGQGSRVLVNENTQIEIAAEVETPGAKPNVERTKLILGEIYSRVKTGNNYEVETPSSVASVRGTEFDASFLEDEATFLGMQGIITVMNDFGSVVLQQLQQTTVGMNQAPTDPETLSEKLANMKTKWIGGVEPTWMLNMVPQGGAEKNIGGAFALTIMAMNVKEGSIDVNANFALTEFGADSGAIEYSGDGGKTWTGEAPSVTLSSGQAQLTCRVTQEGVVNLTARATDAEPAALTVTVRQAKQKKMIQLLFTDPGGGGEKTLIWELEEK